MIYLPPTDLNIGADAGPDNMLPRDAAKNESATRILAGHISPLHCELSEYVGPVGRDTCVRVDRR